MPATKARPAAPTPEQQLKKKEEAAQWAKARLADPQTLIVDVETTGILTRDPETKIVSISMINSLGNIVLAGLINPERIIPLEAEKVHGINNFTVKDCFSFMQWAAMIRQAMEGKHIVAFNAGFDVHQIMTQFQQVQAYEEDFFMPDFEVSCAMEYYAQFVGEWSKSKGDYKWQRLPKLAYGSAHDSVVDCQSTLLLLKKMTGDHSDEPKTTEISLDF